MTRRSLIFLAALIAVGPPAFGQEGELELVAESAFSYTQQSPDGRFVFVMIAPDEREADAEDLAEGLVSVVRQRYSKSGLYKKGEPKAPLWTVDWFAPSVYVANDGIHLIRQGAAAQKPADEAMTFFARGEELERVAVADLVAAPALLEAGEDGALNWRESDRFDAENQVYELETRFRERYRFALNGEQKESRRPLQFAGPALAVLALILWLLAARGPRPQGLWSDAPPRKGGLLHVLANGFLAAGLIFLLTWSRFLPTHALFDEWGFMRLGLLVTAIVLTIPFTLALRVLDKRLSPAAVAATPYIGAGAVSGVAALVLAGPFLGLGPTSHLSMTWALGAAAALGAWLGLGLSQARIPAAANKRSAWLAHIIGAIGLVGAFNLIYAVAFRVLGYFVIGLSNGPSWQTETIAGYILDEGLAMGLVYALLLVFGTRAFGLRDRRAALDQTAKAA